MAVPKRKTSKPRRDKRRSHDALAAPGIEHLPAVRRAQAAPPRVRQLRLLPRADGHRDRRGVDGRARAPLSRAGIAGSRHGARRLRGVSRGARAFRDRGRGPRHVPVAALLRGTRGGAASPPRSSSPRSSPPASRCCAASRRRSALAAPGHPAFVRRPQPGGVHGPGRRRRPAFRGRGAPRARPRPLDAGGGAGGRGAMAAVMGVEPRGRRGRLPRRRRRRPARWSRPPTTTRPQQTVIAGDAAAVAVACAGPRGAAPSGPSRCRCRRPSTVR